MSNDIRLPSERFRSARYHEGPQGRKDFMKDMKKDPARLKEWDKQKELHKDQFEEAMTDFSEELEAYEEAMWAKGEDVPLDKLPEELQENVENPPPGVQALKEKMEQGKAARQRTTWRAASEQQADKLEAEAEANEAQAEADRQKADAARMKEGAGGLYGYTKGTQRDVEASVRKAQRRAASLAKNLLKDPKAADFLGVHSKRAGSKTARLLRAAMRDVLPKIASTHPDSLPSERAAAEIAISKSEMDTLHKDGEVEIDEHTLTYKEASTEKAAGGLYGFPAKTARNALAACTDLRAYIGEIAYDLHSRRTAKHDRITGFLKEHGKTAKCGYSRMMLSCYPDAPASKQASTSRTAGQRAWWLPGKRPGTGVVVGTDDGGRNWFVQVGEAGKGEPILDPVVDEYRLDPEEVGDIVADHAGDKGALYALSEIVNDDFSLLDDRSFGWTKMARRKCPTCGYSGGATGYTIEGWGGEDPAPCHFPGPGEKIPGAYWPTGYPLVNPKRASSAEEMLKKAFVPDTVDGWLEWEDGSRTATRRRG